jgi:hypothetical protein
VESAETDLKLDEFKASLKVLSPRDRRKQMQAMYARDPRLSAPTVADLFGVSERTVEEDRALLRAEGARRFADDPDLRADVFGPFQEMRDAALADCALVDKSDRSRSAHRRTALMAQERMLDVMFRCGYIAEAPKNVLLGNDPNNPLPDNSSALAIIHERLDRLTHREPESS